MPVAKRPGTQVYAGTVIEEGDCVIEVTQSSGESRYDKIVSMIEQSEQLKSAAESHAANLADKLGAVYADRQCAQLRTDPQCHPCTVRADG